MTSLSSLLPEWVEERHVLFSIFHIITQLSALIECVTLTNATLLLLLPE